MPDYLHPNDESHSRFEGGPHYYKSAGLPPEQRRPTEDETGFWQEHARTQRIRRQRRHAVRWALVGLGLAAAAVLLDLWLGLH